MFTWELQNSSVYDFILKSIDQFQSAAAILTLTYY